MLARSPGRVDAIVPGRPVSSWAMDIVEGRLDHPAVQALLREHLEQMHAQTPPGSVHALDLDGLREPDVTFWGAWRDGELLGCAALKDLGERHGEIKSMRTARARRRERVASGLLAHLVTEARRRGFDRLSLETGRGEAFAPAHALYARFEFVECAPFGDYAPDPLSVFLTREL